MNRNEILRIKNLKVFFPVKEGLFKKSVNYVKAVNGISFNVFSGESIGIVGESGSGKTTMARSIMGLVDEAFFFKNESPIFFQSQDVLNLDKKSLKLLRHDIQMIFQDPFSSLNPRMSVGKIIEEGLIVHRIADKQSRIKTVKDLMLRVGVDPEYYNRYPHEFSGGQRQRIGIARALILMPKLVIADEPISALDVSIQVQILKLMQKLRSEFNLTYLFVAHDLSVVAYFCTRIIVMYLGKIMEKGTTTQIVNEAKHPYTRALLSAVPVPDPERGRDRIILKGDIPSPANPPKGCVFYTRCPEKFDICEQQEPPEITFAENHSCFCWLYQKNLKKKKH